jgi:predicted Zn-dependent protease
MIIAKEEQYRTFNLVNSNEHPTVRVKLNNNSSAHQSVLSSALDEAIRRYNAESLTIKFQRVNNRQNITVNTYYEISNVLGSAGFPDADGDPYPSIKMNTYHYNTSTSITNVNYIATIMAHEIGHCIGFRHTDYMDRSYSCGGSYYNEGPSTIGAVHIPGTPTTADAASWMLACVARDVNRPFNPNDKIALGFLY